MGYVKTGPFISGAAPGIDAGFLNNVENFLVTVNSAATDASISASAGVLSPLGLIVGSSLTQLTPHNTVKNGSTSGTMTVSEYFVGSSSLKIVLVSYNNYKNAGSANNVALNAAFTSGAQLWAGFIQGTAFKLSGSTQGISVITALGNNSDGSSTTVTKINAHSLGQIGAFDTISEGGANAATRSGQLFIVGI